MKKSLLLLIVLILFSCRRSEDVKKPEVDTAYWFAGHSQIPDDNLISKNK